MTFGWSSSVAGPRREDGVDLEGGRRSRRRPTMNAASAAPYPEPVTELDERIARGQAEEPEREQVSVRAR